MTNVTLEEAVPADRAPPSGVRGLDVNGQEPVDGEAQPMGAGDQPWQGLRSEEEVPAFAMQQLSRALTERHVARSRPFVVPGGASDWPACSLWNDAYISEAIKRKRPASNATHTAVDMQVWLTKDQMDEVTGVGSKNDFVSGAPLLPRIAL